MVDVSTTPQYYNVKFNRTINEVQQGTIKEVMIIPMIGRIYKPDRDERGFFIDSIGVPDNRVMVMGAFDYIKKVMDEFYCVLSSMDEVQDAFDEAPRAEVTNI